MVVGQFWLTLFAVAFATLAGYTLATVRARRRSMTELELAFRAFAEGRPFRARRRQLSGSSRRLAVVMQATLAERDAERARLERDVEQLQVVLGSMTEGVIAIDARGRLLFANGSADRLFSLGPNAVGKLVLELIRSLPFQEAVDATLVSSTPFLGEITVPSRDNPARSLPRVLAIHGTVLPGDLPTGAVLVFHDVTDLRRLERLRQDFVANVSHELKTPLAAIKAYTETLLDSALHDEEVNVRFLHRIEEQAERLNQLILDLLRLARLESGQSVFDHQPLDVAEVLESCVEAHRERAEAKELTFNLDLGAIDGSIRVIADEEAFQQVFDNLIDNAIKYTPSGGWIRILGELDPIDDMVAVTVADSGIGIPRDDLPRVFERFYRVDKARSRELGGTGLGLAIVKHVVSSIGGQVTVESRPGEGTRFRVQLPRLTPR